MIKVQCIIILMDSSRKALKSNRKLFFKFQISFQIVGRKPKNIEANSKAGILIKNVLYINGFILKPLQTNEKLSSNFEIVFRINYNFCK